MVLFLPIGVLWAGSARRLWLLLLVAAGFSGAIEAVQVFIPGRDSNLGDMVFNTIGAVLGALSVSAALRVRRALEPAHALGWFAGAAVWAVALPVAAALLLTPARWKPVSEILMAPFAPRDGGTGYPGTLLSAQLGSRTIANGEVGWLPSEEPLSADSPARLRWTVAKSTSGNVAPVLILNASGKRELLLVGVQANDLSVRLRTKAADWRLDQPELTFDDVLRGLAPGDTVELRLWRQGKRYCVVVNTKQNCEARYTVGQGWALILYARSFPAWLMAILTAGWLATVYIPMGVLARRRSFQVLSWVLLVGTMAGLLLSTATTDVRPAELGVAALALAVGQVIGPGLLGRIGGPAGREK